MELDLWQFVFGLVGLILYLATFSFGLFKWFDNNIEKRFREVHNRCSNTSGPLTKRIDRIEQEYAHKDDLERALKSVENLVETVRAEQQRMASRMDDLMKWLMENAASNRRSTDK